MPPIVTILLILAIAIVGVLMVTSRNPLTLSPQRQQQLSRMIMVLMLLVMLASGIRFCVGGF